MERFSLASDRLLLDAPRADDVGEIARYCQDPLFETVLTIPWPYRRADAVAFVSEFVPAAWSSGDELVWAIRHGEQQQFVGVISVRTDGMMIGFWLGAEHRGRSIMPEAVTLVADRMFADGAEELRWECVPGNLASASVARKSGFRFEGTGLGAIPGRNGVHDDAWKGVLRRSDDRSEKPGWPTGGRPSR